MQNMATQNTKHNARPPLARSITPYPGTIAASYDCPCRRCTAGPSNYTRPLYGGKLSFRNGSLPPSVPYVEDGRQDIIIVPPSGPYFLNDNVSFFSDDSPEGEKRRGVVSSGVSQVRAIASKARASLDSIRKPQRRSNGTASNETRLSPIPSLDETTEEIADEDARRGIQTAETEPMGLKRRITTKEKVRGCIQPATTEPTGLKRRMTVNVKVRGWIRTAKTEPMSLKRRMTVKVKVRGWVQNAETESTGLKRAMSAKAKVKGWFQNISGGDKVRKLGHKMSVVGGKKRPRKINKPAVGLSTNVLGSAPPELPPLMLLPPPVWHSDDDHWSSV